MKRNVILNALFIFCFPLSVLLSGCKKIDNWLDEKRSISDVKPSTLKDFQGIFDNITEINVNYPGEGLIASDNMYLTDVKLPNVGRIDQNSYLWASDIYENQFASSWARPYKFIEYANIVLEGIDKLNANTFSGEERDNVAGQAYFHRGLAYFYLSQLFCKSYDKSTATTDLGIPVRLNSDVNIPSVRSSVEKVYAQMTSDAMKAGDLLAVSQTSKNRPGKAAAKFLLAKIYLAMEDYTNAKIAADDALALNGTLMDFKTFTINTANPFPNVLNNNPEVIYYGLTLTFLSLRPSVARHNVDSNLVKLYASNDLRKGIFYKADGVNFLFKGSYDNSNAQCFAGFATNELYLMRAECLARTGSVSAALNDLNTLSVKRYSASFTPFNTANQDTALSIILREKRKELPFTGQVRWEDLRRLNKDPRFAKTITRVSNSKTYTLPPNDNKYVFPIPNDEIQRFGMEQNPR